MLRKGLGLGFARCTRAFGRKRFAVWDDTELEPTTPKKSKEVGSCDFESSVSSVKSLLESMPQEVRALIAKQFYFAHRTPSKVVPTCRNTIDFGNPSEHDEIERRLM